MWMCIDRYVDGIRWCFCFGVCTVCLGKKGQRRRGNCVGYVYSLIGSHLRFHVEAMYIVRYLY